MRIFSNSTDEALYYSKVYLRALAAYREAGAEIYLGKMWVIQTIENRIADKRWPETDRDVILQPWQFSAFNKNDPCFNKFPPTQLGNIIETRSWDECWRAATEVLNTSVDIANSANHYHAEYIDFPRAWVRPENYDKREQYFIKQVGRHLFYDIPFGA